ncbi:MAG TPA: hypothetical protein PKA88_25670 [Polyangiaceae bacterium]|nr:hypothetical protein [Polyangiaceae bacterium]HMR76571.1 hypothetical protein [Polyangiaceae bacterium]
MPSKDNAVRELVRHHFRIEPELRAVYRIIGAREQAPDEPIKLLEVNAATVATGSVDVFTFGPTADMPFYVQIAEVTPEEYERLRTEAAALPHGWDLGSAEPFPRSAAAE